MKSTPVSQKALRWICAARPCLLLASLCAGCTITIGPFEGFDDKKSSLPQPEQPRVDPPPLTDEEQKRQQEADEYIAKVVYQGRPILKTVQGYSGTVYDYMTVPTLGVPLPQLPWSAEDLMLPDGVEWARSEVEKYPELWGPVDATVFTRPDLSRYVAGETGATSIEDWVNNYQVHGAPGPLGARLYAGLDIIAEKNRGVIAHVNQFYPDVEDKSLSLIELTAGCPKGTPTEWVGVAIGVDRANMGVNKEVPPQPRLRVEYVLNGKDGHWDRLDGKFVDFPDRKIDAGMPVDVSTLGGAQTEHWLGLIQDPSGNWWVTYKGGNDEMPVPVGYYPAHLFTLMSTGACQVSIYGEVFDPNPADGWVKTEMGSGKFAEEGPLDVAYVRAPKYFDFTWIPADSPVDLYSQKYNTHCYSRSAMGNGLAPWWGKIFFLGGPGGKNPECKGLPSAQ